MKKKEVEYSMICYTILHYIMLYYIILYYIILKKVPKSDFGQHRVPFSNFGHVGACNSRDNYDVTMTFFKSRASRVFNAFFSVCLTNGVPKSDGS